MDELPKYPETQPASIKAFANSKCSNPLDVQVGGSHYKDCAIQPIEYIKANELAFLEGCVIKRATRHKHATGKGRQDIEKAIHELELILKFDYPL